MPHEDNQQRKPPEAYTFELYQIPTGSGWSTELRYEHHLFILLGNPSTERWDSKRWRLDVAYCGDLNPDTVRLPDRKVILGLIKEHIKEVTGLDMIGLLWSYLTEGKP